MQKSISFSFSAVCCTTIDWYLRWGKTTAVYPLFFSCCSMLSSSASALANLKTAVEHLWAGKLLLLCVVILPCFGLICLPAAAAGATWSCVLWVCVCLLFLVMLAKDCQTAETKEWKDWRDQWLIFFIFFINKFFVWWFQTKT